MCITGSLPSNELTYAVSVVFLGGGKQIILMPYDSMIDDRNHFGQLRPGAFRKGAQVF